MDHLNHTLYLKSVHQGSENEYIQEYKFNKSHQDTQIKLTLSS